MSKVDKIGLAIFSVLLFGIGVYFLIEYHIITQTIAQGNITEAEITWIGRPCFGQHHWMHVKIDNKQYGLEVSYENCRKYRVGMKFPVYYNKEESVVFNTRVRPVPILLIAIAMFLLPLFSYIVVRIGSAKYNKKQ